MFRILSILLFLNSQLFVSGFWLKSLFSNDLEWSADYVEDEARRFLDLAMASRFGMDNEAKRQQCFDKSWSDYDYQTLNVFTPTCDDKNNTCQMYVAYSASKNNYVLAFRGTTGLSQLVTEGLSSLNDYQLFIYGGTQVNVNHYFNEGLRSLWPDILRTITKSNPDTTFFVAGHSLGGALASITAARLVLEKIADSQKIRLITFGQPRTWDHGTAMNFRSWLPYSWRVVHNSDPVPHGPPLNGNGVGKPYHSPEEIWYNEKSTSFSRCSNTDGEDDSCSNKLNNFKFVLDVVKNEHMHYMGHDLNKYGDGGCNSALLTSLLTSFSLVLLRLFA